MRKIWQKPRLVVLVRGRPEEFALGPCKEAGQPQGGPTIEQTDCIQNMVNCDICSEVVAS